MRRAWSCVRRQGASRLDVTVRARVKTQADIPVNIPVVGDCGIKIDTAPGANPDIKLDIPINFRQDAMASHHAHRGRRRRGLAAHQRRRPPDRQLRLPGGQPRHRLVHRHADQHVRRRDQGRDRRPGVQGVPVGRRRRVRPFATACTDNVCMRADNTCYQELGITGRARGETCSAACRPAPAARWTSTRSPAATRPVEHQRPRARPARRLPPGRHARDRCGPRRPRRRGSRSRSRRSSRATPGPTPARRSAWRSACTRARSTSWLTASTTAASCA
jgi:hypothetical protein